MATREFLLSKKRKAEALDRIKGAAVLPLLAPGLPMLHPLTGAVLGIIAGMQIAAALASARSASHGRELPPAHAFVLPEDGNPVGSLYLGHGIDFVRFEDRFAEWLEESDGAVADTQVHKRYLAHLFESGAFAPFHIPDWLLVRHVSVTGGSGSGKTELYLSVLHQIMQRGGGGIIFDAKGSGDLIAKVNALADLNGRRDDVYFVTFDRAVSHTYNPLLFGDARQTISTLMKMEAKTKEEFFRNLNRWALTAAILCLQAQPNKPAFNFSDLGALFSDLYLFMDLFKKIPKSEHDVREFVWQFLKVWVEKDRDGNDVFNIARYRERLTGLANNMLSLSHSEYRRIINDYSPDIELKEAILQGKIIVLSVGALSDKEGLAIFARLFMADLARAIGQIQAERSAPLVPYVVFADEYGSMADESHTELWQLARDANISMWLSVQGIGFLDQIDTTFAARMLTNCATHVYFDTRDPKTREFAADLAGSAIRVFAQDSESESASASQRNWETGSLVNESDSVSRSSGYREMRETLLQPEHFAVLEPGDAIVLSKTGTYRLRLPIIAFDDDPPDVDEIDLPFFDKTERHGLHLLRESLRKDEHLISSL